jgi:hypothetical protein
VAQLNKLLIALALLAGVGFALVFGIRVLGPARHHPLPRLDAAAMPVFQAQFDAARDSTRLLVLLSPT